MSEQGKPLDYSTQSILVFSYKWRKQLIVIAILAIVISSIAAILIPNRYKSKVVMFPTATISMSKTVIKEWDDVLKFGEEKESEQLMQLLESDEILDRVSKQFNLYEHYKINPADEKAKLYLKGFYSSFVSFHRTPFYSVEIEVEDEDKQVACDMANYIAQMLDTIKINMQKDRAVKVLSIVEDEYAKRKVRVATLEDSLNFYTSKGFFEYEKQMKIIYKEYTHAVAKGDARATQLLDEKMKLVGANGWKYVSLRDKAYYERNEMLKYKTKYEEALADAQKFLPAKFIINNATPAEKKSYPIRWLIVLISTISALVLSIIALIAFENFKKIKLSN